MKTIQAINTYKIPLLGEKWVIHADVNVIDVSVAPLLPAKALLSNHIFYLRHKTRTLFIIRNDTNTFWTTL